MIISYENIIYYSVFFKLKFFHSIIYKKHKKIIYTTMNSHSICINLGKNINEEPAKISFSID